ncbi:class I SAM-dependent methyltransferase [Salinisphaera sp. RV14]|uniref:class I SAM-dependent methyltransferase n=1 Tax=Salinisphaera sp. RV14 TaxID=3454140 RepID=UPI003F854417
MSRASPAAGSHFADDWLTLREAVDHRSRAHGLTLLAAAHLRRTAAGRRARVVDLGAGRGSNLRYLAPRLHQPVAWRLLDQDAELLAAAERAMPPDAGDHCQLSAEIVDLAAPLTPVLRDADLVTASALIDLVSRGWIDTLAEACARDGAAVLITLSVDGRIQFSDADADDAVVRRALARDQARDKGFGPALGAAAPAVLINALARCGYAVATQPSDWQLGRDDAALARALIAGWQSAATRQQTDQAERMAAWAARRVEAVERGRARLCIGHIDVLGLPNPRRR